MRSRGAGLHRCRDEGDEVGDIALKRGWYFSNLGETLGQAPFALVLRGPYDSEDSAARARYFSLPMAKEEEARAAGGLALKAYMWVGVSEYEPGDLRYMLDNEDGDYEKVEIKSPRGLRVHSSWRNADVDLDSFWARRKAGW